MTSYSNSTDTGFTRRAAAGTLAGLALAAPQIGLAASGATSSPKGAAARADRPRITMGLTDNLQTRPVIDGRVTSSYFSPAIQTVYGTDLFARQLRDVEFDASEMSISSLLIALSRGDQRMIGVPVFTTRYFFHTFIMVRRDSGIQSPSDLKGKRVGVPEYHQTAAMWSRGVLRDEFGVDHKDMETWVERAPGGSIAAAMGFKVPDWVRQIPPEKSIGSMMLSGELDAALLYIRTKDPQPLGDRSTQDLENSDLIVPLFPDRHAETVRYYNKTGLHHVNHCMVLRRRLADLDPSLSPAIVDLFNSAVAAVSADRLAHVGGHYATGLIDDRAYSALKNPTIFHGLEANRRLLETMCRYSNEQGLSHASLTPSQLFPGNN